MFKFSLINLFRTTLLLLTCFAISLPVAQADTAHSAKIKDYMRSMKNWSKILGQPKLDGENLYFGKTHINIDFVVVDGLKTKYGGTATFFVKKGDGFVRVSTNVMKDGKRAIGTMLDPNGPAIAMIKQGKPYYGVLDILGTKYDTGYEPILSSTGEIIGIYYVGYKME